MSDIKKIKQRIANENIVIFEKLGISLKNKRVLDVGFGLGYNAEKMRASGACVFGVEPDKDAFASAVSSGLIDKDKAMNCLLQEIPKELLGTFDIATMFLYCVGLDERQAVANFLAKVIKPDGISVIGIYDEVFIKGDKNIPPVSASINSSFKNVSVHNFNDMLNRHIILAGKPKRLEISRHFAKKRLHNSRDMVL